MKKVKKFLAVIFAVIMVCSCFFSALQVSAASRTTVYITPSSFPNYKLGTGVDGTFDAIMPSIDNNICFTATVTTGGSSGYANFRLASLEDWVGYGYRFIGDTIRFEHNGGGKPIRIINVSKSYIGKTFNIQVNIDLVDVDGDGLDDTRYKLYIDGACIAVDYVKDYRFICGRLCANNMAFNKQRTNTTTYITPSSFPTYKLGTGSDSATGIDIQLQSNVDNNICFTATVTTGSSVYANFRLASLLDWVGYGYRFIGDTICFEHNGGGAPIRIINVSKSYIGKTFNIQVNIDLVDVDGDGLDDTRYKLYIDGACIAVDYVKDYRFICGRLCARNMAFNQPRTNTNTGSVSQTPTSQNNQIKANFISYSTGNSVSSVTSSYNNGRYILQKSGYYSVDISNCNLNSANMKKLAIVPTSTNTYISAVHANGTDILANELITKDNESTSVNIKVYKASNITVKKYQLISKTTVIAENTTGDFTVTSNRIPVSDEYYVRIIDSTGKAQKKLKISYKNKTLVDVDFDLDEIFKFEVPENVPIIGGNKFELTLSDLPINAKTEGDTVYITFGVERDLVEGEFNFKSFRTAVDDMYKKVTTGTNMYNGVDAFGGMKNWKLWKGAATTGFKIGVDTNFVGYCEIQRDTNGKLILKASRALVGLSGSVGCEWQTAVGPIPVVIKAKGEIGTEASITLGFANENKLYANGEVSFNIPKITASAGVGIAHVADVSIYGSATNNVKINFRIPQTTATLSGEFGISAKALIFEGKLPFVSGDWEYYNSLSVAKYSLRSLPFEEENIVSQIINEENYEIDRSYLDTRSEWLSTPKVQTFSLLRNIDEGYGVSTVTQLQSDIYNGAAPKTVLLENGNRIMVWTSDIAERSDYNHTATVYSVYTQETESWSEPQIIEDDGTADCYPQIATDGTNIFVAWCDTKSVFDGEIDLTTMAANCEITYAVFDSENLCFNNINTITDDNLYDAAPSVFVKDGIGYITWVKNSENAVLTQAGTNELYCAEIGENTKVTVISQHDTPILEHKIGMLENEISYAYTLDGDGDLTTCDDISVCVAKLYENSCALNASAEQGSIVFANMRGDDMLLWYKNGNIVGKSSKNDNESILIENFASNKFEIIQGNEKTAIVYSAQSNQEDGNALYASLYSENEFTKPVIISENEGVYVKGANGYIDENGYLRVVYLQKDIDFSEDSLEEHTSLYDAKIVPYFDIAVTNLYYDEDGLVAGDEMEVAVDVKNNGLYAIEGFNVDVLDMDGNIIYTQEIDTVLPVGEESVLNFNMPFPDIVMLTNYTVNITPLNGVDGSQEDNISNIEIGYSSLVLDVEKTVSGNSQGAMLTVQNTGRTAEDVSLYVYQDEKDGAFLGVYSLGMVEAGDTAVFNFSPQLLRKLCTYNDVLYFEIFTTSEEKHLGDNGGYLTYKTVMIETPNGETIEYYYDINEDEAFNILDFICMNKILTEGEYEEQNNAFDTTGDEILNTSDLIDIKKKLLFN